MNTNKSLQLPEPELGFPSNIINSSADTVLLARCVHECDFENIENNPKINDSKLNIDVSDSPPKLSIASAIISQMELDTDKESNSDAISTTIFNDNIELCSTKTNLSSSCINLTNNYNSLLEQYAPLRKKIKVSHEPNKVVKFVPTADTENLKTPLKYSLLVYTINFNEFEHLLIKSYLLDKGNFTDLIKYLQDILRVKFKSFNNVCPINFKSHGWSADKSILRLYARCNYFEYGCGRYKFVIPFDAPYLVYVYATTNNIIHSKKIKKHQLRGIGRSIAKRDIKFIKSSNWRDQQICAASNQLLRIGNNQQILSKDSARKLKQEEAHALNYDDDIYIDICKMSVSDKYKNFIQNGLSKKIYLFEKKQVEMAQKGNKMLLKRSRDTLFFDATGSLIKKFDPHSKRIFLYSLVLHVPSTNHPKGILLPVAEAFLSSHYANDVLCFLLDLEIFCRKNGISWPIAKRICTDWSKVLINAALKAFNSNNNAYCIENYISDCYKICCSKDKPHMVIIQICCSHFFKIVCKDIKILNVEEKVGHFF